MSQLMLGARPAGRSGQMTSVMRALPQAVGPKVLRIGMVQDGRVLEERVIKKRITVTIGSSETNTFVVSGPGAPTSLPLFELLGPDYYLSFVDGMSGRVALQTGISDLDSLKGQARTISKGIFQIRLTESACGKVVVGETTFLFQFVVPPLLQPKPQLPVSVKAGAAAQIDWRFTIVAAFSFLIHFGAIGTLFSDWMDPVVGDDLTVSGILDTLKTDPPPAPPLPPDPAPTETGDPKPGPAEPGTPNGRPGATKGRPAGGTPTESTASLSNTLEQINLQTLAALGSGKAATEGVLRPGNELPGGGLEALAASGAGIGMGASNGLNLGSSGTGVVRPGASNGLASIANTQSAGPVSTGTENKIAGPKVQGRIDTSVQEVAGRTNNASRTVAGMRAGFRACYNVGLLENPDMAGSVRVTATIGPNGEVRSASAAPSGSISRQVANCIAARVSGAQFDPPEGGSATVVIPVSLFVQK